MFFLIQTIFAVHPLEHGTASKSLDVKILILREQVLSSPSIMVALVCCWGIGLQQHQQS